MYLRTKKVLSKFQTVACDMRNLDFVCEPYIEHSGLECAIRECIERQIRRPGIAVLLTPQGAGKTTRAKAAAKELFHRGILSGVIYHPFVEVLQSDSLFRTFIRPYDSEAREFSDVIDFGSKEKPVLIILDDIELLFSHPQFNHFFLSLAKGSVDTQKYIVLALCCQSRTAEKLLLINQGSKFHAVCFGKDFFPNNDAREDSWRHKGLKMSDDEVVSFSSRMHNLYHREVVIDPKVSHRAHVMAVRSGCVKVIRDLYDALYNGAKSNRKLDDILDGFESVVNLTKEEWVEFAGFKDRADKARANRLKTNM